MKGKLIFLLITILWLITVIITKSFGSVLEPTSLIKAALNVFDAIVSVAWGFYLSNILTANKRAIKVVTKSFDNMLQQFKNRMEDLNNSFTAMAAQKDLHPDFIRGSEYIMTYLSQTMRNSMESDARLIEELGGNNTKFLQKREAEFKEIYIQATSTLSGINSDNLVSDGDLLSNIDKKNSCKVIEDNKTKDKFKDKVLSTFI